MNTSPRASLLAASGGVIVHALLWLSLAIGMMTLVPAYKREFNEYQMKLPWMTEKLIATSDWFANYWYIFAFMFIPFCVVDSAILFLTWRTPWSRGLSVYWFLVAAAVPLLLMGISCFGVGLPHLKLLEGLSGK
jgi:type II secretory pathway component PulF